MPEIARLIGETDWIELDFVERERTPKSVMKTGIELHLAGLSLSKTQTILEKFGTERSRSTIQKWVEKADLHPTEGGTPSRVAVDETVIQINDEQFWLYAAVDPATNRLLHVRLFSARTTALTQLFFQELREKHDVEDADFLVDGAPWLHAALHRLGLAFTHVTHGDRNAVERVFREVKRRTRQFSNVFSHVNPETAESWLQAFAVCHNALN